MTTSDGLLDDLDALDEQLGAPQGLVYWKIIALHEALTNEGRITT